MKENPYGAKVFWLPELEYQKAVGQFRLQLNGIFTPFHGYGHDVFILPAIDEVTRLTEDFGLRVRGVDKPLSLIEIRRRSR